MLYLIRILFSFTKRFSSESISVSEVFSLLFTHLSTLPTFSFKYLRFISMKVENAGACEHEKTR